MYLRVCGGLDNWSGIISAHCDKIGSSNNLGLDAQANRGKCHLSCDRRYPRLHLVFSYVIFHHVNLGDYMQIFCIASINMRESPSRNYIENKYTFPNNPFLSYLLLGPYHVNYYQSPGTVTFAKIMHGICSRCGIKEMAREGILTPSSCCPKMP